MVRSAEPEYSWLVPCWKLSAVMVSRWPLNVPTSLSVAQARRTAQAVRHEAVRHEVPRGKGAQLVLRGAEGAGGGKLATVGPPHSRAHTTLF